MKPQLKFRLFLTVFLPLLVILAGLQALQTWLQIKLRPAAGKTGLLAPAKPTAAAARTVTKQTITPAPAGTRLTLEYPRSTLSQPAPTVVIKTDRPPL